MLNWALVTPFMKILTSLLVLALTLSACSSPEPIEIEEPTTLEQTQMKINFSDYFEDGYTELTYWPVDEVDWAPKTAFSNLLPEQITEPNQLSGFYTIGDLTFAMVNQPNSWTALTPVRDWEEAGNTAWSGVLVKRPQTDWEILFQASEDDFNPVGFYLEEEALVLELADDSGAGSGEGTLIRYVYPFAGVVDELLYTWQKEKCDGYYIPELYVDGIEAGTDYCSPVIN